MVLLAMTPAIVAGLSRRSLLTPPASPHPDDVPGGPATDLPSSSSDEPLLAEPAVGKPISHGQVLALWKDLRETGAAGRVSLESLLKGAEVYVPPPPPKPEPTDEYKALMARLRREEEQRNYDRMTTHAAPSSNIVPTANPFSKHDDISDAQVMREINQQLTLIFNFLVSIIGVGATLFVVARWWDGPWRVLLSLAGAGLVGVAEVVVYFGYAARMEQRKGTKKEKREVMRSWVIGEESSEGKGETAAIESSVGKHVMEKLGDTDQELRQRKVAGNVSVD